MKSCDVAVLGAGISGLTSGIVMDDAGADVLVLEERDRVGGCIKTWKGDGYLFELGPNTVLNNSFDIDRICSMAGVLEERMNAAPLAKKRFIVRKGRLVTLPGGPMSFLTTGLFSIKAKLRLLKEPFARKADPENEESIADFVRRRLGGEFLEYAVGPFVSGVYAGSPRKLSVEHAVPKIFALERDYGGLFRGALAKKKGPAPAGTIFSFPDGLCSLPENMAVKLNRRVLTGTRVISVTEDSAGFIVSFKNSSGEMERLQARAVISALPARAASSVLDELDPDFSKVIADIPYADVSMVCLGFKRADVTHPLDGFGFLVPEVENRFLLGCLFTSSLFPGRAPSDHVALTAFAGGAIHPERASLNDADLVERTRQDLRDLLGIDAAPDFLKIERWRPAIPQYNLGHARFKSESELCENRHPGFFLSGNLLYGVSVGNCITNAVSKSGEVLNFSGLDG